jgi:3-isopropylmalate dehydrogenase
MIKKIAIIAGDGIGPEVMAEAVKVLEAVGSKFGHQFEFAEALIGGAAFDVHGEHFPQVTYETAKNSEAILFGSVGGPIDKAHEPKWKNCETNSILAIRKAFNFNSNLRPVKVYASLAEKCVLKTEIIERGIDILTIRELSGCIYFGEHRTETIDGVRKAFDVMEYDEETIRKIAVVAFEAAKNRGKKVTSVDKANVLDCSKLWREVVNEVSKDYPEISLEHILVDNCAMQIMQKPEQFDVLLMPNMFGDILSDQTSVLAGSIGLLPSASLNEDGFGLYEPSGGSAPDIAGKGIANPIAQILSAAMMLQYSFGMTKEHDAIVEAVNKCIDNGILTGDLGGKSSTSEVGDYIKNNI